MGNVNQQVMGLSNTGMRAAIGADTARVRQLTKPDWKQARMDRQTAVHCSGNGWRVNAIGVATQSQHADDGSLANTGQQV